MKLLALVALFTSAAVAAPTLAERDGPSGHEVEIKSFTYGGTGCPGGSVGHMMSDDRTTLTLLYDAFTAQAGEGVQPKDYRKNCQLNIKLHYPQGWQFSIFKADYRGHATIPQGATGFCKATYYFSGDSGQISSTKTFTGPYDQDYIKTDVFGVTSTVWSPCGKEGLLNINSAIQLNPLGSKKPALLTAESTDLKFKQIQYLQWRKCNKKA